MTVLAKVEGLYIGSARERWPDRPASAIAKQAVEGSVFVTRTGIRGDQQADTKAHGGPEKAIHHYPADHLAGWRQEMPELAGLIRPGGFGENLSTTGVTERDLCIGDVLALGSARIQVSHGRQPCWKLNAHMGSQTLALRFQKTGNTGWYYRVLEEGEVRVGDDLVLIERRNPDWPLARTIAARFDPNLAPEVAAELAGLEDLAPVWRDAFRRKIDPAFKEDLASRLLGPKGA